MKRKSKSESNFKNITIKDFKAKIVNDVIIELNDRWLSMNEICTKFSTSRSTIYRQLKTKAFPQPVYLGNSPKWRESVVNTWMQAKEEGL